MKLFVAFWPYLALHLKQGEKRLSCVGHNPACFSPVTLQENCKCYGNILEDSWQCKGISVFANEHMTDGKINCGSLNCGASRRSQVSESFSKTSVVGPVWVHVEAAPLPYCFCCPWWKKQESRSPISVSGTTLGKPARDPSPLKNKFLPSEAASWKQKG